MVKIKTLLTVAFAASASSALHIQQLIAQTMADSIA
jgi:hypothetical protein